MVGVERRLWLNVCCRRTSRRTASHTLENPPARQVHPANTTATTSTSDMIRAEPDVRRHCERNINGRECAIRTYTDIMELVSGYVYGSRTEISRQMSSAVWVAVCCWMRDASDKTIECRKSEKKSSRRVYTNILVSSLSFLLHIERGCIVFALIEILRKFSFASLCVDSTT